MPSPGQQHQQDTPIDESIRASVIEGLASRIESGYVVRDVGQIAARKLRAAVAYHDYVDLGTARPFAEKLTSDLRTLTRDKHIAVYFDPEIAKPPGQTVPAPIARERFNFGFNKIERLRGNIGYLDLRSFANVDEGKETASLFLSALANFDAIIVDLRQNGGGNTPMVAYIASYFFSSQPVHLTDMFWRDQNRTVELWTSEKVEGRRSDRQPLFVLVGPSTFSAAEDFAYSMQQLKRATIVGEKTGGGAHMGRGLQRLSPLFTAFIPTGMSVNPITKTNWEGAGVKPDVKVPEGEALAEAQALALSALLERESDPGWRDNLRQALSDLAAGK